MKNKLKRTTSMLCALTVAAVPMTMSAFTASATEITNTVSDYTLTIPSSFTVANAGWNKIEGGVTASGTLADGKKLVVTAQSDNGWALRSGDNSIGYNLAKAEADYNANAEAPTWEFESLTTDGVSQGAGLIVDNYDEAPAGNYSDNVVFTASVEDAVTTRTVTWTGQTMMDHSVYDGYQDGFTAEGVTLTTEGNSNQDVRDSNYFYGRNYNSFSVSDGKKLTKIVIESGNERCELDDFPGATVTNHVLTAEEILEKYPFMSQDEVNDRVGRVQTNTITWTGNAETVRFKAWISPVEKITFTIEE